MNTILLISTILLDLSGVIFSFVYLWLNIFSGYTDLATRNKGILNISLITVILSLIFALLSCLLSDGTAIEDNIKKASVLYAIIATSWFVMLLACVVSLVFLFVSKKTFKSNKVKAIGKISIIALPSTMISLMLAWLFS